MIKCKEAFEIAVIEHLGPEALAHGTMSIYQAAEIMWQAAWNGATQNAVQVLREANENGTDPVYWAEAIEQEQCE